MGSLNGLSSWEECHVMTHFTPFMKAHWRGSTIVVIYRWIFLSTFSHPYLNEDKISIVIVTDPLNKYIKFPRKSLFSYMSSPVDGANEHWSVRDGKVATFPALLTATLSDAGTTIQQSYLLQFPWLSSVSCIKLSHTIHTAHSDIGTRLELHSTTLTKLTIDISQQEHIVSGAYLNGTSSCRSFMRKSLLEENRYESNNEMDQIYTHRVESDRVNKKNL